jgi:hypothetical protein
MAQPMSGSGPGQEQPGMKEQAGQVAGTAMTQSKEVAGTAVQQAGEVAAQAMDQAHQVAGEVKDHVQLLAGQAASEAKTQANAQADRLAEGLRTLAGQVQSLLDGDTASAGQLPDYARQVSQRLESFASRIGEGGAEGVVDDLQRFARRRPGAFLAGAAAVGFAAGRVFRGTKAANELESDRPAGYGNGYGNGYATAAMPPAPAGLAYDAPLESAPAVPAFEDSTIISLDEPDDALAMDTPTSTYARVQP